MAEIKFITSKSSNGLTLYLGSLGKLFHALAEGLDMVVPSESVGGVGAWGTLQGLENSGVSLAWNISRT